MVYVADLDEWLEWSSATTYADDTTIGVSSKYFKNWHSNKGSLMRDDILTQILQEV